MNRPARLSCIFWLALCVRAVWAAPGDGLPTPVAEPRVRTPALAKASNLVLSAQSAADPQQRRTYVDQGRELLAAFIRDNPTHNEMPRAEMLLGVFMTLDGKLTAELAAQQADDAKRADQLEKARKIFRDADRNFATATDRYAEQLKALPSFIPPDTPEHRLKEGIKQDYIQARMYHAGVVEELASTYPSGSAEARELYQAAADRYDAIYREYRILFAGLVARLKQGQCYRNLGDTKRALGLYHDILSQPDDLSGLRRLRVTAMYLSLESWTTPQEKLYELALSQGEEYLTHLRPEELRWPEWQAVRYHTARGYRLAAEALPADRAEERDEFLLKAHDHAAKLAETAGPYQASARELLDAWSRPDRNE